MRNTKYIWDSGWTVLWINKKAWDIHFTFFFFSTLLKWSEVKWTHAVVSDSLRPCGLVAHQAPLSMGFSRQEYWSGLPLPSPYWGMTGKNCIYLRCTTWRFYVNVSHEMITKIKLAFITSHSYFLKKFFKFLYPSFLATAVCFLHIWVCFCFVIFVHLLCSYTYVTYGVCLFLSDISLGTLPSWSIHVVRNGKIPFLFIAE